MNISCCAGTAERPRSIHVRRIWNWGTACGNSNAWAVPLMATTALSRVEKSTLIGLAPKTGTPWGGGGALEVAAGRGGRYPCTKIDFPPGGVGRH